mgnify:CR=1 FL=1
MRHDNELLPAAREALEAEELFWEAITPRQDDEAEQLARLEREQEAARCWA